MHTHIFTSIICAHTKQPPELQLASWNLQHAAHHISHTIAHAAYSDFCLFMISYSLLLPREVKYLHSALTTHR